MENKEYVRHFINDNCIYREPNSKVLLRKGAKIGSNNPSDYNTWLFNIHAAMYDAKTMQIITNHFYETFKDQLSTHQIVGLEHASTAMISSFVFNSDIEISAFSIRKEQKTYGTLTWFEGLYDKEKPIILIDDMSSSSRNALNHGINILKKHNFVHDPLFYCIVDLGNDEKIQSMFKRSDFELDYDKYVESKQIV